MVTPAPYTTGATTKAPRPSQADDRLLPPRRMMTAMEADAERRIGRALSAMRRALLDGLTDDNAHLMLARLESEEVLRPFTDTVMAVLTDVSLAGAQWGAETVNRHAYGAKGVIDFVWDIVNEAAERFARTYAYSLVTGITETTRTRLQGQISEFVRNQETINQLARRIKPLFGDVRAKMIAVTETTRAFAEGNQIAWKESGVIEQKRWVTANDELVCPVCGPLHRQVVDIDDEFEVTYATKRGLVTARFPHPPAHVSCRCGMTPVIVKVGDRIPLPTLNSDPRKPDYDRLDLYSSRLPSWSQSLTSDQQDAIKRWTESDWAKIRREVELGKHSDITKNFLSAIESAPRVDGTVWRGIKVGPDSLFNSVDDILDFYRRGTGTVTEWIAPASTSLNPRTPEWFGNGVVFEIQSKSARYITDVIAEAVTMPNTRYRIVGISNAPIMVGNKEQWIIHLIEI